MSTWQAPEIRAFVPLAPAVPVTGTGSAPDTAPDAPANPTFKVPAAATWTGRAPGCIATGSGSSTLPVTATWHSRSTQCSGMGQSVSTTHAYAPDGIFAVQLSVAAISTLENAVAKR
jgi:hypothetical protein